MDDLFGRSFLSTISLREILAFAVIFFIIRRFISKLQDVPSKYHHLPLPPSPPGLPLFGNMFSLRSDMRPMLKKWSREIGGIVNLRIGPNDNMILINDLEVMQEAFIDKCGKFSGRPAIPVIKMQFGNRDSILWETTPRWQKTRRLGYEAVRNCFGLGKGNSAENRVIAECEVLVDYLRKQTGTPFNPNFALSNAVANVVCSVVFGRRYEHADPVFQKFVYNLRYINGNASLTSLQNSFPMLLYTPLFKQFRTSVYELISLIKENVIEHRRESDTVTEVRDVIDFYLAETARQRDRGLTVHTGKDREWRAVFDLFAAGVSTTNDMLFWALLLFAKHQGVLTKCHKEIDDIIGSGRAPNMSDQDKLPFVSATIQEIMRYRPVVPLGVPRENDQETLLCGYRIPKRSVIIMDIWSLHMNPKYWDEPEKFNPSRFLSEDGKTVLNHPALNAFGMGLRICLGERLARMSVFLILTNILQKFTFRLAEESKSVDMDGDFGITWSPYDYKIVIKERQAE